jgi:hypothetical protein
MSPHWSITNEPASLAVPTPEPAASPRSAEPPPLAPVERVVEIIERLFLGTATSGTRRAVPAFGTLLLSSPMLSSKLAECCNLDTTFGSLPKYRESRPTNFVAVEGCFDEEPE